MKKKVIWSITVIASAYLLGMITYRNDLFPLNVYRYFVKIDSTYKAFDCPSTDDRSGVPIAKLYKYANFSQLGALIGDSVIEEVYDPRNYGLDRWTSVALSGQMTHCFLKEIKNYTALEPQHTFIYLGGNDIDKERDTNLICRDYEKIVATFQQKNLPLTISEIHYGLESRRKRISVKTVNKCINEIGKKFKVKVIPTPNQLAFKDKEESLLFSQDGEHLNHEGYALWMKILSKQLPKIVSE